MNAPVEEAERCQLHLVSLEIPPVRVAPTALSATTWFTPSARACSRNGKSRGVSATTLVAGDGARR